MNLTAKKMLAKKTFKVKCMCAAFVLLMVVAIALTLNTMFANASMPKIWLDSPAKGKVVNVNTRLLIRPEPGDMSTRSGSISNGTTLQIIGYTEYDPSDPWSPWLAIDTSKNTLLEPSNYSIGWVSSVYVNVPVTGVKMAQIAKEIKIGTTANTVYTVIPPCADNTSVTWSSSNTSVATVDGYGKVTARTVGTAVITVRTSDGGKTATCTYTVKPLVSEIKLNKTTSSLGIGKSETLTATIFPTDAFDKSLTWISSDIAIATVDQNGKVTGKTDGTVTITATAKDGSGKSASCTYTILPLVNSVTLNKDSTELNIGETETLTAIVLPDEAYDKTLTWSSADSSVASVDQNGVVTAKSSGTTTIKVMTNDGSGIYDTCTVTVKSLVTAITLNKYSSALIVGQSETLNASIEPDNASDSSVTWSSSDESIAVVDENGNVTALRAGKAIITASANDGSGKSASCEYTIEWRTGSIALNKRNVILKVGTSDTLKVIFGPEIVGREVEWFSSDSEVATVDSNGKVSAVSVGTATITAVMTDGSGESASCVYTVKPLVNEIKLNKSSIIIIKGQTEKLSATVNPIDAYDTGVIWSSDNTSIATVDQNGNVKGKAAGKTIIKATAKDGSGVVARCEVTVTMPVSRVSVDKNSVIIKKGDSLTLNATVLPTEANNKSLTWSSSNVNIAKVDQNGKITAVNGGKVTITAKANDGSGKYDTCEVQVIVMVESIVLNKSSMSMSKGKQARLTATVKPDDATKKSVTWSSSDWAYARVDQNGNVVAKSSGVVYISATATDGSNVSANCEIIINYPRTGWVANIGYTASVNVRKSPNTTETVTTARYGRVLTVTAPAVDGWYPVILSDGTHGYISAQFVVWEKPYDPPAKTTVTKNYIYVSKSGYPKSGWAGNQLKQTQKLKLKSSPKSSSNTVRSAPYATKGVVRGKTSNGYYVSGGNGYQVVYGVTSHITFKKPTANTALLSSNDRQIISKSNASVGSGCCGGGGSGNDIPNNIPDGDATKTENHVDVEDAPNQPIKPQLNTCAPWKGRVNSINGVIIRADADKESEKVGSIGGNEFVIVDGYKLGSDPDNPNLDVLWYHGKKEGSDKSGYVLAKYVTNTSKVFADSYRSKIQPYAASNGFDADVLLAILDVETGGKAFNNAGKLTIRFENHIFYGKYGGLTEEEKDNAMNYISYSKNKSKHRYRTEPEGEWKTFHDNQTREYEVFEIAKSINDTSAHKSISMGISQIMGFNYELAGYSSPQEMYNAFSNSEEAQLTGVIQFLVNKNLSEAINSKYWEEIGKVYNGDVSYGKKIEYAYNGIIFTGG